jgi:hypothetical protein
MKKTAAEWVDKADDPKKDLTPAFSGFLVAIPRQPAANTRIRRMSLILEPSLQACRPFPRAKPVARLVVPETRG